MTEEREYYHVALTGQGTIPGKPADADYDAIRLADIQDVIDEADDIGQTSATLEVEVLRWLVAEVERLRGLVDYYQEQAGLKR